MRAVYVATIDILSNSLESSRNGRDQVCSCHLPKAACVVYVRALNVPASTGGRRYICSYICRLGGRVDGILKSVL